MMPLLLTNENVLSKREGQTAFSGEEASSPRGVSSMEDMGRFQTGVLNGAPFFTLCDKRQRWCS